MAVALLLLKYTQDQDWVVAALLHDIVEDTSLSIVKIRAFFGEHVAFLASKATNLAGEIRRLNLAAHEKIHNIMRYQDP